MFKAANVGATDRFIRLMLGAVLIVLPYFTSFAMWSDPIARYGIPLVGAVLIFTAIVRFCPAYKIIGANTCGR